MVKDNVSDFLVQVKNAGVAGKPSVIYSYSKFILALAELLQREGYIQSVDRKNRKGKKMIEVGILYKEPGVPKISGAYRVSKLSRRVYEKARNLRLSSSLGNYVLSTPKGLMTDKIAKKENVGGEVLFKIW